jgi:hypothetical protein
MVRSLQSLGKRHPDLRHVDERRPYFGVDDLLSKVQAFRRVLAIMCHDFHSICPLPTRLSTHRLRRAATIRSLKVKTKGPAIQKGQVVTERGSTHEPGAVRTYYDIREWNSGQFVGLLPLDGGRPLSPQPRVRCLELRARCLCGAFVLSGQAQTEAVRSYAVGRTSRWDTTPIEASRPEPHRCLVAMFGSVMAALALTLGVKLTRMKACRSHAGLS